ncbi:MAG: FKBP-type peptidyl-prolyl cis-trans isomerase [Taibaiella sp.]|nr:FKBP-type peptidyl-prolyl cis-trans isomerase [Taibaiella sp.]
MIKRILPVAMLSAAILSSTSCKQEAQFKKTKGIEYKIVKDVEGKTASVGDVIELHIHAFTDTAGAGGKRDTVELGNSRKDNNGKPITIPVQETKESAQWQSVFPMLSAGDSAVVRISCDTMLKNIPAEQKQGLPSWLKAGNYVTLTVNMVSVKSKADADKEVQQKTAQQAQGDDKLLQDYFAKNNIKAEKTSSGLYYVMQKEGTGEKIAAGQMVAMNYTGKLLDGTTFDSNLDSAFHHKELFKFPVGAHQVIPGWDEGVMMLKKGSKATFYIISSLAYGDRPAGPLVPPNSILIFDVEVVEVAAAGGDSGPNPQAMNAQAMSPDAAKGKSKSK